MPSGFLQGVAFTAVLSLMAVAPLKAEPINSTELEVAQINSAASASAGVGSVMDARRATVPIVPFNEVALSLLAPIAGMQKGNSARIEQTGTSNVAALVVAGQGNSTMQAQHGIGNSSNLVIRGDRNRVAIDQDGRQLKSDVSVGLGGLEAHSGQTLIHIQRGRGNMVTSQPISTSGMDGTPRIVVDTNMGRKVFSLPDGIGARPVELSGTSPAGS